jgi:hypothetical protein
MGLIQNGRYWTELQSNPWVQLELLRAAFGHVTLVCCEAETGGPCRCAVSSRPEPPIEAPPDKNYPWYSEFDFCR